MNEDSDALRLHVETTAEIVAAYVSRNSVPAADLPNLIRSVHESLSNLGHPPGEQASTEPLKPAVSVKKSVTDEFIISLEDGRKFKSMKRYLAGLGMTPSEYRAKWGLPADYPMVAPAYAARRSELAKTIGLGRKGVQALATVPAASPPMEEQAIEPAKVVEKKSRKRTAKAE